MAFNLSPPALTEALVRANQHWQLRHQEEGAGSKKAVAPAFTIALSREAGTFGAAIARAVADQLGWPWYSSSSYYWSAVQQEAFDRTGIPGQNVAKPLSLFGNHQLIEIDMPNNTVILFDPSYAKQYQGTGTNPQAAFNAALKQFQDSAIAAFYTPSPGPPGLEKLTITPNGLRDPLDLTLDPTQSYSI